MTRLGLIFIIFASLLVGGAYTLNRWKLKEKTIAIERQRIDEFASSRGKLMSSLKYPRSAEFRGDVYFKERGTACGEFNAKNSMGGYVGYKRYVAKPGQFVVEGGGFNEWDLEKNPVPAPDYMSSGLEMISKASLSNATALQISAAKVMTEEIFEWLWKKNCK